MPAAQAVHGTDQGLDLYICCYDRLSSRHSEAKPYSIPKPNMPCKP